MKTNCPRRSIGHSVDWGSLTLTIRSELAQTSLGVGFRRGSGDAHCLINESDRDVVYLEVGDRSPGDAVVYPDDDLRADWVEGGWRFAHKDGTPY